MGPINLAHAPSTDQVMDQVGSQLRSGGQAAHTRYNERPGGIEPTRLSFGFTPFNVVFGYGEPERGARDRGCVDGGGAV